LGISTAFVIHPHLRTGSGARKPDAMLEEARQLVAAIGLEVSHAESIDVKKPRPDILIGSGHVERITEMAEDLDPLIVVNASLSPVQQRNLETRT